jgi:hypothetical protein
VRAIENPGKRQEFADRHATLFAPQNPRFDPARFHAACGTQHNTVRNEANKPKQIAPIHENFDAPTKSEIPRCYAIEKQLHHERGRGTIIQATNPATEFHKTVELINERKARFDEKNIVDESSVSVTNVVWSAKKPSNPRLETLRDSSRT